MAFDVVVLGSLHMDIMVSAPDRPRRGETVTGDSWGLKPGGKGGNQAVEAALAGARTAMVGAVGGDDFGAALLDNLKARGVDTSRVAIRQEARTGISVAITDAGGDYGAVIVSGVNLRLDAESVDSARPLLAGARWLPLQHEIPDAANVAAARAARGAGVRTILNAAPARPFAEGLAGLLDILAVNAIEAEALGSPPFDTLAAAAEAATHLLRYAEAAVVTAGGAGVAIATRAGAKATIPGHAVKVVSTHGAGDCFIGALAARLARGETLADAARWANATAALRVSGRSAPGASGGPATLADLLQALG